jgi:hypothetical protein
MIPAAHAGGLGGEVEIQAGGGELCLDLLALGDVDDDAGVAGRLAVLAQIGPAARIDPADRAVGLHQPILAGEVAAGRRHRQGDIADPLAVLGVDGGSVALHRQAGLGVFGRDVVHLGVAGVGIDLVGEDVPLPGPDHAGHLARHLIAFLGGLQRLAVGHRLRDLDRRDQHPADAVRRARVGHGTVADGEVAGLLGPAAGDLQRQLLEGEPAAGPGQDVLVEGADRGLEVRRGLVQPGPQRRRMPLVQGGGVGVVIDQDEVGTPAQGHGEVGGQDHV